MNAQQLKPYLFWIICAVILIVQLIYFGSVLTPRLPEDERPLSVPQQLRSLPTRVPESASAAQEQLQRWLGELKKLVGRAETTLRNPPGQTVIDPSQAADLRRYIIVQDWVEPLRREVDRRQRLVDSIRQDLSLRSQSLAQPISARTDPVMWYAEYEAATARLVRHLVEEEALVLPPAIAAAGALDDDQYRNNRSLRELVGLITAEGAQDQFRDEARRHQLSYEFRIIDRVTRVLAGVRVTPPPHPFAQPFSEVQDPREERVRIRHLSLSRGNQSGIPRGYQLRLELSGSPAALLAASQALDGIVAPVIVRLGSKWERLQSFEPRDKHHVANVPMHYSCDLLVLDFYDQALAAQ